MFRKENLANLADLSIPEDSSSEDSASLADQLRWNGPVFLQNRGRSSQVATWANRTFNKSASLVSQLPPSPDLSDSFSVADLDSSGTPFLNRNLPEYHAIRERLRNFFARRNRVEQFFKRPWVFLLQFVKLCLITLMTISLSSINNEINSAVDEIEDTITSLLVPSYADGADKVLTYEDLETITVNALGEYFCLSEKSISVLGYPNGISPDYPPPVQVEIIHYARVDVEQNWTVTWNDTVLAHKEFIHCALCDYDCVEEKKDNFSIKPYDQRFLEYKFRFNLRLLLIGYLSKPHGVNITYYLSFSNQMETGLTLSTSMNYSLNTNDASTNGVDNTALYYSNLVLDLSVVFISLISTVTVIKKAAYAGSLYTATRDFIKMTYGRRLNRNERRSFLNYWHVCIFIADVLLIVSAILKLLIDIGIQYPFDMCTLLLGMGVWLSYLGLLRYLKFSKHYSAILNTIIVAIPHLARFMICVIVVSLAYVLCGWLVLSPYNVKFSSFWLTLATLFSLLNGDDMFATFIEVETNDSILTQQVVKVFSQIYLYSYVCFFIYVVLSVCIAMIEDAYEVVSNYKNETCPWFQNPRLFWEFATSWEDHICKERELEIN